MRKHIGRSRERGQVLAGVILMIMLLLIIVPAMVQWVQIESKASVKNSKSTTAFNLAEAAAERGMWKLKSSTTTFANAQNAVTISGYDLNTTYTDVSGGTYRIGFTSGVYNSESVVIVQGEGRDANKKEIRALQAIYQNQTIPAAIVANGNLTESSSAGAEVFWGPIMATGNINMTGSPPHFPRKFSKQTVLPYDTNGITPPNTDNVEWWSDYDVPELPVFDFAALRSSAAATNTLNCNGTLNGNGGQTPGGADMITMHYGPQGLLPCGSACVNCVVGNIFQDNRYNSNDVWYWDGNVVMNNPGVKGTVIVRGNLLTNNGDWYGPFGPLNATLNLPVPPTAWMEYMKCDTSAVNQYPADNGLSKSLANYVLGNCGASCEDPTAGVGSGSDVGFYGFVYVGGNINVQGDADVYGGIWVVGNWNAAGNNLVLFNEKLQVPTLNVVLVRLSWKEATPRTTAWN
jgi:Tfp pilus assembly protein PilX